jgi:HSP20 family protein
MRVTDLIPWSAERRDQPVSQRGEDPVAALQSNVNRAFNDFLRMFPIPLSTWQTPPLDTGGAFQVDVVDHDKDVQVTAELPGVEAGDIDVRVSDGMLTVSADKNAEREAKEDGYVLRERSFGHVERIIPLPEGVDPDAAQASFKRGVLTVTIPKTAQARSEAKRVPVQSP